MVRDCDHEDIEILYPQNRLLEVKVFKFKISWGPRVKRRDKYEK